MKTEQSLQNSELIFPILYYILSGAFRDNICITCDCVGVPPVLLLSWKPVQPLLPIDLSESMNNIIDKLLHVYMMNGLTLRQIKPAKSFFEHA